MQYGGSTWYAKVGTTGNAPPTLPTTENTQWILFARSGTAGVVDRGTYSGATGYDENDIVLNNGSTWLALQSTTGNAPPVLPAESNAYWRLLARKGTDGSGTGDVVGPAGSTDGYLAAFNGTTGKLLKQQILSAFAATILDDTSGAAMFATMGATFSGTSAAGSAKLPSGLELKWGTSVNSLSDYRLLFPIAFANDCFVALPVNTFDYGGAKDRFIGASTSNVDKNGFDIRARNITNGGGVAGQGNAPVRWLAVGW